MGFDDRVTVASQSLPLWSTKTPLRPIIKLSVSPARDGRDDAALFPRLARCNRSTAVGARQAGQACVFA